VAKNKSQVVFEMSATRKRARARAGKKIEIRPRNVVRSTRGVLRRGRRPLVLLSVKNLRGWEFSFCHKEHEEHKDTSQHHFLRVLRVLCGSEKSLCAFPCFLWPFGGGYAALCIYPSKLALGAAAGFRPLVLRMTL
jgi:hypothetical protein